MFTALLAQASHFCRRRESRLLSHEASITNVATLRRNQSRVHCSCSECLCASYTAIRVLYALFARSAECELTLRRLRDLSTCPCRVPGAEPLENLKVVQLVKKFPSFYVGSSLICRWRGKGRVSLKLIIEVRSLPYVPYLS